MADIAERSTFAGTPGDGSASFESQRAMLRAVMGRRGPGDVLANAELAVFQEGPQSPWRTNALSLLGSAYLLLGEMDAADAAFGDAVTAGASGSATAMMAVAKRASIAMARGDWLGAEEHAQRARALLVRAHHDEIVTSLIVYAVGARVAIHRGDLD